VRAAEEEAAQAERRARHAEKARVEIEKLVAALEDQCAQEEAGN
jgi:hypothetical protein